MKKSHKLPKLGKGAWFVPLRGSYLPMTWQAWALYVPYAAYIVAVLYMVMTQATSWLDYLALVPYFVAAAIVMTWIARQKS